MTGGLFARAVSAYKQQSDRGVFNDLVVEALPRELSVTCLADAQAMVRAVRTFLQDHFDKMWILVKNNPAYLTWVYAGGMYAQFVTSDEAAAGAEWCTMGLRIHAGTLSDAIIATDALAEMWPEVMLHPRAMSLVNHLECMVWYHMTHEASHNRAPAYSDLSTACARFVCMRRECTAYRILRYNAVRGLLQLCVRSSHARHIASRVYDCIRKEDGVVRAAYDGESGSSMRDIEAALTCMPGDIERISIRQSSRPTPVNAALCTRVTTPGDAVRKIQRLAVAIGSRCDLCKDCIVPRARLWDAYMHGPTHVCPNARGLPILMHITDDVWFVVMKETVSMYTSVDDALVEWVMCAQGSVSV